jgi:hypothetical protein
MDHRISSALHMEDLNNVVDFGTSLTAPHVDPQFFTAIPSAETPMDRIMSVFTVPKEALQGIEQAKNAWLMPLLIALLLTAASFSLRYFVTNAAEEEHVLRVQNYDRLAHNKNMGAEQKKAFVINAQEDKADANKSAIWGFAIGFVTPLLATVFSCLIFFLLARTVFKAEHVTFKMILTAAAIPLVITGLGDVLGLIVQAITGNSAMTISPAAFVSGSPQQPAFVLAMQFNLFKIWDLVVFSLAFASLVRRQPIAGYAVVFITWLIRIALWTGMTVMFQKITAG